MNLQIKPRKQSALVRIGLLCLFFCAWSAAARAQAKQVRGMVTDEDNEPLAGASVYIKSNPSAGTLTGADGKFQLQTEGENAVLVVSYVGYKTVELEIGSRSVLAIQLAEKVMELDELVVVGYGMQKKSDLTSSVALVDAGEIKKLSVPNVASLLQGRASGVIVTTSGEPGASPNVVVRGLSSLGGGAPLYVIDGVPSNSYYLDPDDVESVEILKDAAAAAIYGTRAASGVVLITTKKGQRDSKMKVDFSSSFGVQNPTHLQEMANSIDFLAFDKALYENAGKPYELDLTGAKIADTDWQDEIRNKNAFQQKYNIVLSGGGKNSAYSFSAGVLGQEGMIKENAMKRYSFRLNTDFHRGKFSFSPSISYFRQEDEYETTSFNEAQRMLPIVPVYDDSRPDGYGYGYISGSNPVGDLELKTSEGTTDYLNLKLKADYSILDDLKLTARGGVEKTDYFGYYRHAPHQLALQPEREDNYHVLEDNNSKRLNLVGEAFLNYTKELQEHRLDVMLGGSFEDRWYRRAYVKLVGEDDDGNPSGFFNEDGSTIDAGEGSTSSPSGYETQIRYVSYFSRVNYAYADRYLLQATIRRDASSKFGKDNRWGTFPSVSAGWNLGNETFMDNVPVVSHLKLRGGYGVLGNDRSLGAYAKNARFYSGSFQTSYPVGVDNKLVLPVFGKDLQNDGLRWEQTVDVNLGIDFGLWEDRLSGSVEYYRRETEDVLLETLVAPSSGKNDPYTNLGSMENRGLDLLLTYRQRINDLNFSVSGTMATLENEVTKLNNDEQKIKGKDIFFRGSVTQTQVGDPAASFFLLQADGIFQNMNEVMTHVSLVNGEGVPVQPDAKPGDVRYKDLNGDGLLNDKDKVYSGKYLPDLIYSFSINADYKEWDLSMFFQGVAGNKIYNVQRLQTEGIAFMSRQAPSHKAATDFWSETNTDTDLPRPALGVIDNARHSTRFLEDGGYFRLKNIQLGYALPERLLKRINVNRVRLYVSADNLFTLTDYTGTDPEINSSVTESVYSLGLGYPAYPAGRTYVMGIQLSF
ncbi:MAG: TonB-dependent receptor [Cytophagales bacterium]|nr:TonB-dependent receptor [Cytophagales bacterium]